MRRLLVALAAAAFSGCAWLGHRDPIGRSISREVELSERSTLESHTRSRLAAIENALNGYIRAKGRVPRRLDELVPDHIAEIPEVVLGLKAHKDSSAVRYYPSAVIQGGQINGSAIDDTGGWGYAFTDKRVIVFVDCTHTSLDGTLWYQMRGVY